jgi:hypothetical protein
VAAGAALAAIALLASTVSARQARVQEFPLRDASGLVARGITVDAAGHLGRQAVRLTKAEAGDGVALLPGVDFQDGTIEADVSVNVSAPPGVRMPGFIGIAFRAQPDASRYELFYLRPGNARGDDQAMRNHAVQYSATPGFGWYALRRQWPAVYESYVDITPGAWTHVRIAVAGRTAKLYVGGAHEPALVVDGLKGEDLRGGVGLWGFSNEESYFSNLRVTHAPPQRIANGSDAAGTWEARLATDAGVFAGTLELRRDGAALSGEWSGALGARAPVTGTWRNGYVELTFPGEWPREAPGGPAAANVTLAGWVDGDSARGRARIDGRADGQWTATLEKRPDRRN